MIEYFEDSNGKLSMMRLIIFLIVITALVIAIIQVVISDNHEFDYVGISALITLALGGKYLQKTKENENQS
ncbi:MAG: hypothetical protein JXR60_11560 [Bacteroidales bacterium]|nr:hypothetical protein [Bacteroidales bacterium]